MDLLAILWAVTITLTVIFAFCTLVLLAWPTNIFGFSGLFITLVAGASLRDAPALFSVIGLIIMVVGDLMVLGTFARLITGANIPKRTSATDIQYRQTQKNSNNSTQIILGDETTDDVLQFNNVTFMVVSGEVVSKGDISGMNMPVHVLDGIAFYVENGEIIYVDD